jgi:exopolysaccharide biosynthesis predicted pyruvyltransferase EpsI
MDARFVMTDSFHGTVFSVLFEKEFRVINNVARGADRITSLLKRFNITHKLLDYDNKHIVNENNFTSILENLRSESITFLRDSLK